MPGSKATQQMDPKSVRALFEAASGEGGAVREALLASGCNGNAKLRALVEEMLAADIRECRALDMPLNASVQPIPPAAIGDRVGPYLMIRELGSGGMGTVFLASRDGQTGQFAVKVVRWLSPDVWQRFEREKAILGALNHPNIARLMDSGTAADGSPYFVMEYVDGRGIYSYCEELHLSIDSRIRLFRQVCAAVRYLHQNLVVHRDLKPGNILVTSDGQVKLLDFGIAKLLDGNDSIAPTANTIAGVMTPDYGSPEQVRGGQITTLADVYSLGVLLFELLSGKNPFAAAGQKLHELLRRICEEAPPRPSTKAENGKIGRKLRGELDNIILTALRKEPERRYASAEAFDEDLRRYLDGRPVLAQGDSFVYRARKFVVRNKASVAAAAVFLALLAGGIAATRYEANIAREERARAERQAAEADRARTVADEHRIRAERFAAEAERERANAQRRLDQLEKLAHGAVNLFTSTNQSGREDDASAMIAENARNSLLMLNQEGMLKPEMARLIDATVATLESHRLAGDRNWQVPQGWFADGDAAQYRVALDRKIVHGGKSSLFLRSIVPNPQGSVSVGQKFSAALYRGSRVRLRGFLRGEKTASPAGLSLWCVFAGEKRTTGEPVDVAGTFAWRPFEIIAEVPPQAERIEFRLYLTGTGTLWADDFIFEKVAASIPLSGRDEPLNLNFNAPVKQK